jgi:hypothetical protein
MQWFMERASHRPPSTAPQKADKADGRQAEQRRSAADCHHDRRADDHRGDHERHRHTAGGAVDLVAHAPEVCEFFAGNAGHAVLHVDAPAGVLPMHERDLDEGQRRQVGLGALRRVASPLRRRPEQSSSRRVLHSMPQRGPCTRWSMA